MRCKTKQEEDSRSVDLRVSSHQINLLRRSMTAGGLSASGEILMR
jgi:hypothetical protein